MPPNTRQARVIDPILSEVAHGYVNASLIGTVLFPVIDISVRGGSVIKFDKSAFRLYNARRAPGGATKRIQIGYSSDPIALVQDALEGLVPFEHMDDADQVPGIDLGTEATTDTMDAMQLLLENEQATLATDPVSYDANHKVALAGTDKWSDYANSDPGTQLDDYKETVRQSIGTDPNTLVLGVLVYKTLKRHPKIKEQFKYTSSDSITAEMLAEYFDLERVVIGKAVSQPENAPDDADFQDVWGNNAILAYVPTSRRSVRVPSYGYTYRLRGHPMVEQPYQDRNAKSWVYPVTYDRRPYITSMPAGFLIQNPK